MLHSFNSFPGNVIFDHFLFTGEENPTQLQPHVILRDDAKLPFGT